MELAPEDDEPVTDANRAAIAEGLADYRRAGERALRTYGTSSDSRRSYMMKPEYHYEIILYWSDADQACIAEVPELPGCAADGPTYREALANAEVIVGEWIETAQELGRPIPAPRGRLLFA